MSAYAHSAEAATVIDAAPEAVFDFLDDQANLSAHMSEPSAMMLGTTMSIHMEDDHTRSVGSRFGFEGRVLGVPLKVEEIVTSRTPPRTKAWETTKEPVLWVMGQYAMRFTLVPMAGGASLSVRIDYNDPTTFLPRLLGVMFGRLYAKWCGGQMCTDASRHFSSSGPKAAR